MIKKLIAKPEKRLTAQEALEHKWFKLWKGQHAPKSFKKRNLKSFKHFMKN